PNSRSMVSGSKVPSCHISNWLIAVLGTKSAPFSHLCWAYHFSARSMDHLWDCALKERVIIIKKRAVASLVLIVCCLVMGLFISVLVDTKIKSRYKNTWTGTRKGLKIFPLYPWIPTPP